MTPEHLNLNDKTAKHMPSARGQAEESGISFDLFHCHENPLFRKEKSPGEKEHVCTACHIYGAMAYRVINAYFVCPGLYVETAEILIQGQEMVLQVNVSGKKQKWNTSSRRDDTIVSAP